MPVITKLTPNITDIRKPARAAKAGGTDAVSLINTINSITGVNLDTFVAGTLDRRHAEATWRLLRPGGEADRAEHGGRDRPRSARPTACRSPASAASTTWRDAAEFMALGAGNVQVCTAAMTYGFKIVQEMITGLDDWMDEQGPSRRSTTSSAAPSRTSPTGNILNLNYVAKAKIDQDACIKCGRCHIACEDTSHQAITQFVNGVRHFEVIEEECVGCNLCVNVCPVENCITMEPLAAGTLDQRTGQAGRPELRQLDAPIRTTRWPARPPSEGRTSQTGRPPASPAAFRVSYRVKTLSPPCRRGRGQDVRGPRGPR